MGFTAIQFHCWFSIYSICYCWIFHFCVCSICVLCHLPFAAQILSISHGTSFYSACHGIEVIDSCQVSLHQEFNGWMILVMPPAFGLNYIY
uniref:Uncharacterized protein n=1 Tax=Rhizophora mucronata TaxID=61149 RepID=A0A2P2QWS9_RHIMU